MTDVTDHIETDVRERILVTAERLFREIGYQKTTVADIAKALQMSPANVYRFFDSKKSINAGVARRLMGRLRELLATVHRMNSDRYVADSKMHEMVAVAMEENWDVCKAHMQGITGDIADVSRLVLRPANSMSLTLAPLPCALVPRWFVFSIRS